MYYEVTEQIPHEITAGFHYSKTYFSFIKWKQNFSVYGKHLKNQKIQYTE